MAGAAAAAAGVARPSQGSATGAAEVDIPSVDTSQSSKSSKGPMKKGPVGTLLDYLGRTRASARAAAAAAGAATASSSGSASSSGAGTVPTYDASSGPQPQLPKGFTLQHSSCAQKCERDLACGHRCSSACHEGKPCPPCNTPCPPVSCSHSKCRNDCMEPCAPCAEPCTWKCSHKGRAAVCHVGHPVTGQQQHCVKLLARVWQCFKQVGPLCQ